jgi:hypothetical protein
MTARELKAFLDRLPISRLDLPVCTWDHDHEGAFMVEITDVGHAEKTKFEPERIHVQ